MKKSILAIAVLLNCTFITAQTEFDALKLVQSDINGTARYMSMAGAFGALGGDASAIKDNPAGLGIYRTSEITGTLNFNTQKSNSNWQYLDQGSVKNSFGYDNLYNLGFNNFAYIKANPTIRSQSGESGLMSSNWSFSYNRLKSFDRNSTIQSGYAPSSITDYMGYFTGNIKSADLTEANDPYNNTNIPWISELAFQGYLINENVNNVTGNSSWSSLLGSTEKIAPTYTLHENGYVDEYSIGWAGNINNMFYLGATVNLQAISYNAHSIYSETFSEGGGMTLDNNVSTSGAGFNLNLGAIIRPIDELRLGIAVHTPTLYALTTNNYTNLDYFLTNSINGYLTTPDGYTSYRMNSPWKVNASAAVIVGQKGLISAEYDYSNVTGTKYMDQDGNSQSFSDENDGMKIMLNNVHTIKIGAEYKLTDNFSLRGGYATMNGATNNAKADKLMSYNTTRTDTEYFQNNRTDYLTAGFGYREAGWFIDFAYMNKILDETFYPYNTNKLIENNPNLSAVNSASVKTTNNNFVVTLGLKF